MTQFRATARAHANIALAKYWGKADVSLNLPAVPSLSITLEPLTTQTTVVFDPAVGEDELVLNHEPATPAALQRVRKLLDRVRREAGVALHARVTSVNDFPTASGLASSASGFAALATAARAALGLDFDRIAISRLARSGSASAARSVFGGFVELAAGIVGDDSLSAFPLHPPEHWDLSVIVAVTDEAPKALGSTDAMGRSAHTSPFYPAWVELCRTLCPAIRDAVAIRDLDRLGPLVEQSATAMHACAWASLPPILYARPATLAALDTVRTLRASHGVSVWATMDAGPQVKALCHSSDAQRVESALKQTPGVRATLVTRPGKGVELLE